MKPNNWIMFVVSLIASVILLLLWYAFGVSRVDAPLDLVLSVVCWIVVIGAIITVVRIDKSRQKKIRTVYIADDKVFNSEKGLIQVEDPTKVVITINKILNDLDYDISIKNMSYPENFDPDYIVCTSRFCNTAWEGGVISSKTQEEVSFRNREELFSVLGLPK